MPVCPACLSPGELGAPCVTHPELRLVDELQLEKYRSAHGIMLGQCLAGRFALVRVLGKGGMGWVYEAVQEPQARRVAIKVLRADVASERIVRDRFLREAEILGRLQHPNLVELFDSGTVALPPDPHTGAQGEDLIYFAMELLRGQTLAEILSRPRFFAAVRLVEVARGIAAALAEAHRNQIVHRDLKPENVLLVRDAQAREVVKLVDFGIARLGGAGTLTQTGMVFGTPAYMSPEQCIGEREVGPAADCYAFGILLYRMLTDRLPFSGDKPLQLLMAHMNRPVPPIELRANLGVPRSLLDLTLHCLEKLPADRPADGAALVAALERVADDLRAGRNLVYGAGGGAADATAPGKVAAISAPQAEAILAQADAEPDAEPIHDTIVLGGDVEIAPEVRSAAAAASSDEATTQPQLGDAAGDTDNEVLDTVEGIDVLGPQIASSRSQEDIPTLVSLPEPSPATAYRVAPRSGGPSALREPARKGLPVVPLAIGGVLLLAVGVGAGVMLAGGGGDSGSAASNSTAATRSDTPADPAPTPPADAGANTNTTQPAPHAPATPPPSDPVGEAPAPEPVVATPTPTPTEPVGKLSAHELRARLAELQKAAETARATAVSDAHRVEIERGYEEQMRPLREELARRGLEP